MQGRTLQSQRTRIILIYANGHMLPTGQKYVPPVVMSCVAFAWYCIAICCMVLHGIFASYNFWFSQMKLKRDFK